MTKKMWASSILTTALFWCVVLFTSSRQSSGIAVLEKPTTPLNKRWKAITQLRNVGRLNLQTHQHQQASLCYSAILQLVEGAHEPRYIDVRRRCGVLLGRCEEILGNTYHAIARCSEVINEAPEITPAHNPCNLYASTSLEDNLSNELSIGQAASDIGEAHYCRARCLRAINEPLLALTDLQESLKYLPDENAIYQDIAQIELELLQKRQLTEAPRATEITPTANPASDEFGLQNMTSNTAEATTTSSTAASSTNVFVTTDTTNTSEGDQSEHRVNFLEHCLLNYPSLVFSKKQVCTLCALAKSPRTAHAPRVVVNNGAKMTPLQDQLGSLLPGGTNGVNSANSLSNAGIGPSANAMGSLLGLLNPAMSNMNGGNGVKLNVDSVISLLPLLSSFTGMSAETSGNVAEILKAVSKVYGKLSSVYKRVMKHRDAIVIALTVLWVLVTAVSAFHAQC